MAATLPAMFGGSLISAQLWRLTMARGLNTAAGVLLFAFGIVTVLGPLHYAHQ